MFYCDSIDTGGSLGWYTGTGCVVVSCFCTGEQWFGTQSRAPRGESETAAAVSLQN